MRSHIARKPKRLNRKGGIEGLPMELMIIVVIAALGCGLMMTWMNNIEAPETIGDVSSSVDQIVMTTDSKTTSFNVTVTDGDGDPISGATVVLSGCGVHKGTSTTTPYAVTDSHGVASFSGITLSKTTSGVGFINVQVSAGDHGEDNSLKIPVVR